MSSAFEKELARQRERLKGCDFFEVTVSEVAPRDTPVRMFCLRRPHVKNCIKLLFVVVEGEEQVVVVDYSPVTDAARRKSYVSAVDLGLDWFAAPRTPEELCWIFLQETWVPEKVEEWLRAKLEDAKDAGLKHVLEQALEVVCTGDEDDPARSEEAFAEWYLDGRVFSHFGFVDGGSIPNVGYGYDPDDAAYLVAVQETFARLLPRPQLHLFQCDGDIYVAHSPEEAIRTWALECGVPYEIAHADNAELIVEDPFVLPRVGLYPHEDGLPVTKTLAEWTEGREVGLLWKLNP